jgi:putative ABC transport system substrate-binding protein
MLFLLPLEAAAQRQRVWRIGYLAPGSKDAKFDIGNRENFIGEMRRLGYAEGTNIQYELRYAEDEPDRLSDLAAELVQMKVDVIVASGGTPSIRAAQRATTTIPIVMVTAGDPVGGGFAASLARPGGNITGSSLGTADYAPKLIEILRQIAPKISRVAVLINLASGQRITADSLERAAPGLHVQILPIDVRSAEGLTRGFEAMSKQRAEALIVTPDSAFARHASQISGLAIKHKLPSISVAERFAEEGLLMSYGQDLSENVRRAAHYVDKILKGAKPGDLPIEQPLKFQLVVNLRSARALGIRIPGAVLARADRVIE